MSADAEVSLGPSAAVQCRRRVHLNFDPDAPRARRAARGDGLLARLEELDAHSARVITELRRLSPALPESWDPAGPLRPPMVIGALLATRNRFGRPDLLLFDGDGYVPVIVRGHRTTDPGSGANISTLTDPLVRGVHPARKNRSHAADTLALAHHHRMLAELGLAGSTAIGGVIGRGGWTTPDGPAPGDETVIVWHQLAPVQADYESRFSDRLAVAQAAAVGGPALARPSRIAECRSCPWWPVCSPELVAAQDISLISAGADVTLLHLAGIRTVGQLAGLPRQQAAALPLTGIPAGTARVRARAFLAGVPMVRRTADVRVRRADIELDVDMESYLDDGAYLWGTYLSGPGVAGSTDLTPGYRAFVSWTQMPGPDEGRAFAEFWTYLTQLRDLAAASGLTFAAYCYSRAAEERWLMSTPLRYPSVAGMPSIQQVRAFCESADWVDIYAEIRSQFVVPGSMKLKVLAPYTGFSWRDAEPGGENSMAWYRAAIDGDAAMAERVLQYNEDDVRATLALREWITDRSAQAPTVAELDAD